MSTFPMQRARLKAGLTVKQLAARVGIDQAHISRIERGRNDPRVGLVRAIAGALGVKQWWKLVA